MTFDLGVFLGLVGAALSLTSYLMKSMLSLRVIALAANVFFIVYGVFESNLVALVLHTTLLPINAKRAWDIRKLIRDIESARSDTPVAEWLLPHMTRRIAKAGTSLWRRNDPATEMLYVQSGTVRLVEYDEKLGAGSLIGEMAIVDPTAGGNPVKLKKTRKGRRWVMAPYTCWAGLPSLSMTKMNKYCIGRNHCILKAMKTPP
jgi:hypothetical protein